MVVKLNSHYLLDLVYSLLTCLFFVIELIVGSTRDQFWQYDSDFFDKTSSMQGLMVFAPTSATGINDQGVLTNVVTLLNEFWTMMVVGLGWYLALRVIVRWMMAIELVNNFFRLDSVWIGMAPREPPDPYMHLWLNKFYDAVYIPLVDLLWVQ